MKKILLLTILAAAALNTQAQNSPKLPGVIRIRLDDERPIVVSIDNRRYDKPGRRITLDQVRAGRHEISVYRYTDNGNGNQSAKAKLVYSGSLKVKSDHLYDIIVTPFSGMDVEEKCCVSERNNQQPPTSPKPSGPAYDNRIMEAAAFQTLRDNLRNQITDSGRMDLVKAALNNNRINTEQAKALIMDLNFDSSRVDLAKWMYPKVVDPKNYWQLNDAFSFQSSKDELNNFLKGK